MEKLKSFKSFLGKNMYGSDYYSNSTQNIKKKINVVKNIPTTCNISYYIKERDINKIKDLYSIYPNIFQEKCGNDTILATACEYGNLEIVKFLIEEVKLDINQKSDADFAPISVIAYYRNITQEQVDILKYLLSRPGIDLKTQNSRGSTPLLLAVKATKRYNCSTASKIDSHITNLYFNVIELLLKAGADPYDRDYNIAYTPGFDELYDGDNAFDVANSNKVFHCDSSINNRILELLNKYKKQ
jgi:ankyrin repeat protein